MNLSISNVALWMLISVEVVFSASLKDTDRTIVKRDVDIIPALIGGAVDTTLDLLDKFGKGYGIRGSSKFDAFGLHDEKKFEVGASDSAVPQEREKRSAVACSGRNGTATINGTTSNVNTRNASNPDVETLARRKRSAQSNESSRNGPPSDGFPPGPPPNGDPPGPPPNGDPPGPPPNGDPPGPPPNGSPPGPPPNFTQRPSEGSSQNRVQSNAQIEEPINLVRERRTPCRNATDLRSKRSPQRPNDNSQQNEERRQLERDNKNSSNTHGQNMQNDNRNVNGYGGDNGNRNYRTIRSAKPCNGQNPNGQPIGASTNTLSQLPQQPQPQQQQNTGVNINDLQRDQIQRFRRGVNDPDKVVPASDVDGKNLFERIVQIMKEMYAVITRTASDMDMLGEPKKSTEISKL